MNKLAQESSPYLLQHADNPVDWHPWGQEALERARSENKPILVSIGYSTCHWCHVMEHESFEDEAVADFMNAHFINIKVDREERPDLDAIYMDAVQILTGSGGWPLNCFLTPDLKPFFGGTYFPPEPKYKRPSWLQVLKNIQRAFHTKRETVEEQANKLMQYLKGADAQFLGKEMVLSTDELGEQVSPAESIFRQIQARYDHENGGFGTAPKFPNTMGLEYLISYHHYSGDKHALDMVEKALQAMIKGGIYDQIGGGFARYTVDQAWFIPHFEKMLYDNALLLGLLANVYKVSPRPIYKAAIEQTIDFLEREMQAPEKYFYAALDADSEGEEGKFYVWTSREIDEALGADAALFKLFYGVEEHGNWEGKNILYQSIALETAADSVGLEVSEAEKALKRAGEKLVKIRNKRIRPGRDEKALLAWNALLVQALVSCYQALGSESIRNTVLELMTSLSQNFHHPERGVLVHSVQGGRQKGSAYLDDYVSYILALLSVYQVNWSVEHLEEASNLLEQIEEKFGDKHEALLFFAGKDRKDLVIRKKDITDGATPSANAMAALVYRQLGILKGNEEWRKRSSKMLDQVRGSIVKYPLSFSHWAQLLLMEEQGPYEIAVIGGDAFQKGNEILREFLPRPVIMASKNAKSGYPLLKGRAIADETAIYLCRDYVCQRPVTSIEAFRTLLN